MHATESRRALAATLAIAASLGLDAREAIVLQDSDKVTARLRPCDTVARVALADRQIARFEVGLGRRLAAARCPVAALDPRVEPSVYERDGVVVTFWTYYDTAGTGEISPAGYARALGQLHAGLRTVDATTPHFTDRVAEAAQLVTSTRLTPALAGADRKLLASTLDNRSEAILASGAAEQLLHGEPHPGNLLNTPGGPVFIDLETCCRGPVEFDVAHVPETVSARYADADPRLVTECRALVLAMVAAWRSDARDQFPAGHQARQGLLAALRGGPPWPALDVVMA
jgi:phosphotransferase family enzyme